MALLITVQTVSAQKDYIGQWSGVFNFPRFTSEQKDLRIRVEFYFYGYSDNQLNGRRIIYPNVSTSIKAEGEMELTAEYNKADNSFNSSGYMPTNDINRPSQGIFVFRFADKNKDKIVGQYFPSERRSSAPEPSMMLNKVDGKINPDFEMDKLALSERFPISDLSKKMITKTVVAMIGYSVL